MIDVRRKRWTTTQIMNEFLISERQNKDSLCLLDSTVERLKGLKSIERQEFGEFCIAKEISRIASKG